MKRTLINIREQISQSGNARAMRAFNELVKSFAEEDSIISSIDSQIKSQQKKVDRAQEAVNDELDYLDSLKYTLRNEKERLTELKQRRSDRLESIKSRTVTKTVTEVRRN